MIKSIYIHEDDPILDAIKRFQKITRLPNGNAPSLTEIMVQATRCALRRCGIPVGPQPIRKGRTALQFGRRSK